MNRFRTRKKGKEAQNGQDDKESQPLPLFTSKTFKRAKKPQAETPAELDLSSALPPSDDFRTSLLMPNLSARFSMLREQDDPNSKIGKANDDSVLFPKRASRLNVFGQGNNPLGDIAEVSSLHASSARPSFAIGRGSFASGEGYATDDGDFSPGGSVMSRSRPGEGNNLFGGRQKVYKIPVASTTPRSGSASEASGTGGGGGMLGKAVYENDVTLSAFQKLRAKEKEQQQQQQQFDLELEMQRNRHDTEDEGSLASRPSINRTSTSNTSVDSAQRHSGQGTNSPIAPKALFSPTKPNPISTGMERNPTKTRRYGQGIDPNPQPPSAISRLESLSRQRAAANDASQINRSLSKSATSLNERFQHRQPVYASSGFRPTSPPPSAPTTIAEAVDAVSKAEPEISPTGPGFGVSPQLSPAISESDEQRSLEAALQPEDRGKATAMGLFNKPATQYDDTKFSQRQRQMYEGRDTPPLRRRTPPPPAAAAAAAAAVDVESSAPSREVSNSTHRPKVDTLVSQYNNPPIETRLSGERSTTTNSSRRPSPSPSRLKPINGTFLSGGDSESEDEPEPTLNNMLAAVQSLENVHPAFRSRSNSGDSSQSSLNKGSHTGTPELRHSETRDLNTIQENEGSEEPVGDAPDSPTLGPSGLGLSGLVRTHLRHDSDTSIYQPPSPGISKIKDTARELNPAVKAARDSDHAASVHSNPWEYDDLYKPVSPASDKEPAKQTGQPDFSSMSMRAKQMLGQATALRTQTHTQPSPPDNSNISPPPNQMRDQSPRGQTSHGSPWQEEHKPGHQRGASSETQNEREELANELAERRRKVQEKLRSFAESESRSSSPSPGHRFQDYSSGPKHGNAFAMLKSKTGRNPVGGRTDAPQSKAMKMLGMDQSLNSSSPILPTNDAWLEDEDKAFRNRGRESRSGSPHLGARNHNRPWQPQGSIIGRASQNGSRESFTGEPSPPSHRSSGRTRSGSDVSGRSKSQPRYRDDLEPVGEHAIGRGEVPNEEPKSSKASASVSSSSRPSEEVSDYRSSERSASVASGRYRSNSRSAAQSYYYESNPPVPFQTHQSDLIGNPPRPSPVTPYSANATPPLNETSPIHSSTSTPTLMPPMNMSSSQRNPGLGGAHKRIIDKSKISEPTFLSSTSNVPTVGLPPGASLTNGSTPPIPPMNPRRRRQTTTQTLINAFKSSDRYDQPSMPGSHPTSPMDEQLHQQHYHQHHAYNNHQSIFSDEEKKPRPRQKLRKISSEGGNLNAKARQQLMNSSSPALPQFPKKVPMEGGMF